MKNHFMEIQQTAHKSNFESSLSQFNRKWLRSEVEHYLALDYNLLMKKSVDQAYDNPNLRRNSKFYKNSLSQFYAEERVRVDEQIRNEIINYQLSEEENWAQDEDPFAFMDKKNQQE